MGRRVREEKRREGFPLVVVYLVQHILHVDPIYVTLTDFAQLLAGTESKACIAYLQCGGFASADGKLDLRF